MNADAIRKVKMKRSHEERGLCSHNDSDRIEFIGSMGQELAAQLADVNESLRKIANPPMVVNGSSPWVWLKYHDKSFVIDKNEVAFVCAPNDHQCLIYRRNEGGEDAGSWCEGTLKEICTKLGIPLEGKE
jgi:hypothetical protein